MRTVHAQSPSVCQKMERSLSSPVKLVGNMSMTRNHSLAGPSISFANSLMDVPLANSSDDEMLIRFCIWISLAWMIGVCIATGCQHNSIALNHVQLQIPNETKKKCDGASKGKQQQWQQTTPTSRRCSIARKWWGFVVRWLHPPPVDASRCCSAESNAIHD